MMTTNEELLRVSNLKKYYPIQKGLFKKTIGFVKAVDDISFNIEMGETFGLVGESGCGKTTTGRCILRAIEPTAGEILFKDSGSFVDVSKLSSSDLKRLRREMQLIFQDPYSSLNPRMTVLDIVAEPLLVNGMRKHSERKTRVADLLSRVGIRPEYMNRYPHAFSGGQRQRICIARALALNPKFVVCDESVSALDVSIQAQILNLLQDLQQEFGLTYLFIAHDLSVVEHISNRVAVMYVGKIVEISETENLFVNPAHPYTEALISAVPKTDPELKSQPIILKGEVADPSNPPAGCSFHPRCMYAKEICSSIEPSLTNISEDSLKEHYVACHFALELRLKGI